MTSARRRRDWQRRTARGRSARSRERARDEADAERAAGDALRVEADELHRDRDAEGGDGEVVGAQPQRQRADEGRGGRRRPAWRRASRPRSAGRSRPRCGAGRRGQQGRHIGADRHEAGDADIEQARLAPLQVQAEADDRIGQRRGAEEGRIAERGRASVRLPEQAVAGAPAAPRSGSRRRRRRAIAPRRSATAAASDRPTIRPPSTAPGHAADAAQDGGGEQRQQQVEAHERPDLHQRARP